MTDTSPAKPEQNRTPPRSNRSMVAKSIRALIVTATLLVGALLLVLALATFIPGLGILSTLAAFVAATLTPHFALAGLVVLLLGVVAVRGGLTKGGRAAVMVGAGTFVANAIAVALIATATVQAGGSVNLLSATVGLSPIDGGAPDRREVYDTATTGEDLTVSIYQPAQTSSPSPTILYIHGGGWTTGDADMLSAEARHLADQGWLVVSVDYELSTPTKHTWNITPQQVACAAAWVGQNANDIGADLNRLAFWGDSAGGNLAINTAHDAARGTAKSSCGGSVPAPGAVVADFPAVDVTSVYDANFDTLGISGRTFCTNYVGGSPAQYPERYAALNSASFSGPKAPSTLVIVPKRDQLVVPEVTYDWVDQARAAGLPVDLVKIPLTMHVYNQIAFNSIGSQAHLSIGENYLRQRLQ